MEKRNYKFVKPAASLILGATVLIGSLATSESVDAASSKYQVSNSKLVVKKTGKTVKGYKQFNSKLYKDGKLYTGLKGGIYYKNGKKGTAKYKGVYYSKGKAFTGLKSNTYYKNGKVATGWYGKDSAHIYYVKGKPFTGIGANTGRYFKNGKLSTGWYGDGAKRSYYVKGKAFTGISEKTGRYFVKGKLNVGLALYNGKLFNGEKLNTGVIQYNNVWYKDSTIANGKITTPDGKEINVVDGVEKNFALSIMHTNDTHAHLDNAAKRTTAIKNIRAKNPDALLLDAGDVFSGTLYFNEFRGQADLKLMNLMGYDAMTFGNHEFDLGSSPEGHQALADFIKGANFPFISANVNFSADARFTGLFTDLISSEPEKGKIYNGIVKVINGEKVGIFGLTTEETVDIASPGSIAFENYITEAEKAVKAFEGQGVDKIIALSHIGYDDNAAVDNDLTLAATVKGIDVIVGGHSHTELKKPVIVDQDSNKQKKDPTVIVQAYQYSDFLGTLDVEFDTKGTVVKSDGELIALKTLTDDPEAVAILKPYSDKVAEVNSKAIGAVAKSALENPRKDNSATDKISVRSNETALGNIITDGMLSKAKTKNKDVIMALQNGGGIRAGIDAGEITVGEVITVLPFGNTLATMTLTGADLKLGFETSFKEYPAESGGFLHVSGAKVEFDSSKPVGQRVVSIKYKDASGNYIAIQDGENYTVATNAFTAKGGDGYDIFAKAYAEGRVTDLGLSDWENLAEQLTSLKEINPTTEGRIVDIAK